MLQEELLLVLRLSAAKEQRHRSKTGCQQHAPAAGNDFTGVSSISRPRQRLTTCTAKKKPQKIEALARVLRKEQHRIRNLVSRFLFDIAVLLRAMDNDRGWNMNSAVANREQVNEGVVFFHTLELGPSAEPFVKDLPSIARGLAQRHVGADA